MSRLTNAMRSVLMNPYKGDVVFAGTLAIGQSLFLLFAIDARHMRGTPVFWFEYIKSGILVWLALRPSIHRALTPNVPASYLLFYLVSVISIIVDLFVLTLLRHYRPL